MNTLEIYLHVGFSKTATTSLQNGLFSQLEIANLGKPYIGDDNKIKPLYAKIQEIKHRDELRFDLAKVQKHVNDVINQHKERKILISDEGLTFFRHNDQLIVAERLKKIFGDAKILFTIREQGSWLKSLYFDDCRRCDFTEPPPRFERWFQHQCKPYNRNILHAMDFWSIIAHFITLFGKKNILVLPFESLYKHPVEFSENLGRFFNQNPDVIMKHLKELPRDNSRPSKVRYYLGLFSYYFIPAYSRRFFPLAPSWIGQVLNSGPPIEIALPQEVYNNIKSRYAEGNRHLSDAFGLSLEQYGYEL